MVCFYFVWTILTTVGFGDIYATNTKEAVREVAQRCLNVLLANSMLATILFALDLLRVPFHH